VVERVGDHHCFSVHIGHLHVRHLFHSLQLGMADINHQKSISLLVIECKAFAMFTVYLWAFMDILLCTLLQRERVVK
jgi:hypothetical protein